MAIAGLACANAHVLFLPAHGLEPLADRHRISRRAATVVVAATAGTEAAAPQRWIVFAAHRMAGQVRCSWCACV
jgi:hypothetical protein